MRRGPSPFLRTLRRQVVHDGIKPCVSNQVKVFIFIDDGNQRFFHIPSVTENDVILLFGKPRHHKAHYRRCQFRLGLLLLSHTEPEGHGKEMDHVPFQYRDAEHQAYEAATVQVMGAVMRGVVKELRDILEFLAEF